MNSGEAIGVGEACVFGTTLDETVGGVSASTCTRRVLERPCGPAEKIAVDTVLAWFAESGLSKNIVTSRTTLPALAKTWISLTGMPANAAMDSLKSCRLKVARSPATVKLVATVCTVRSAEVSGEGLDAGSGEK
jgi:hypothetical protein